MSPRAGSRIVLALLIAATFGLRMWGLDFLLPHQREQDAQLVQHLRYARNEAADDESGFVNAYPYVLPYLLRVLPSRAEGAVPPETLDEHLAACSRIYVETRWVVATVSLLAVPMAYFLARRFVAERWALFAAALTAGSFLLQWFGQEARPHAAAAAMSVMAVVAALRMRAAPSAAHYALAGTAAALALGTLHHGAAVLLAGLAAHFTREGPRRTADHWKLAIPLALVALGARAFYPFYFAGTDEARSTVVAASEGQLQFGRHAIALDQFRFGGAPVIARTFVNYEPILCAALLAAFALACTARGAASASEPSRRRDALVVGAYLVPMTLVLAAFDETYERFVTPLVPYAALLVTIGIARAATASQALLRRAACALAALVLASQVGGTVRLAWLRAQPDTMELAARYAEQHLAPQSDALVLSPKLELPVARTRDSLFQDDGKRARFFSRWAQYSSRRGVGTLPEPHWRVRYLAASSALGYPANDMIADDALGFLRRIGPGVFLYHVASRDGHRAERRIYEELRQHGQLLTRIAADHATEAPEFALEFQDPLGGFPNVWWCVMTARALGPSIEIFRVESW